MEIVENYRGIPIIQRPGQGTWTIEYWGDSYVFHSETDAHDFVDEGLAWTDKMVLG